ncbi:MAG TPA: glycosyltransferase [Polyangiaceae bacterium]|nr:glycosyltransferase [Polyangiaceae bacterium]
MIPPVAHFLWFGRHLPWVYALAVRSAAARGGFERVVLHHDDDLSASPGFRELASLDRVETRRLDAEGLVARAPGPGGPLVDLFRRLRAPAARANVTRAALLALEGGVYLDLDTVTVASLTPLREEASFFCGEERLVFPGELKRSRSPLRWGAALGRTALRDLCRRAPEGWRHFRRIEHLYPRAANNAVLGAEPGHPLLLELLARMAATPRERQTVRFALGTHLLQAVLADAGRTDAARGLRVHGPPVFYPLGPEISEHWFRFTPRPRPLEALLPDTRVVHWYASVRTEKVVGSIDPAYVRENAGRQLFSALARPLLEPR